MKTIGENIRLKLITKGISAGEFAIELNNRFGSAWTSNSVYEVVYHPGIHNIISSPKIIMRIADVLKCNWRELFLDMGICFPIDKELLDHFVFLGCGKDNKKLFLECCKLAGVYIPPAYEKERIELSSMYRYSCPATDDDCRRWSAEIAKSVYIIFGVKERTIGQNIERLMKSKDLAVEEFVRKINEYIEIHSIICDSTSVEQINDMINRHASLPNEPFICIMANVLNCPCTEFFFGVPLYEKLGFGSGGTFGDMKKTCLKIEARREKELKDKDKAKAAEFQKACNFGGKLSDRSNLRECFTKDTSFMKYVDCFESLKTAIFCKQSFIIKELIKIKEFQDILASKGRDIIEISISEVLRCPTNLDILKTFCILATTKEVREIMYKRMSVCYHDGALETYSGRTMLWLIEFFANNHPQYDNDNDNFYLKYKDALLKEVLG